MELRSEHDDIQGAGVALLTGISQSQVTLTSISGLDVMTHLLKSAASLRGPVRRDLITSRLIAQMGGLQGCRAFKSRVFEH